jgi:DNA-binding response OmpR family regulator
MKLLVVDSDRDLVEMLTSLLKTYGHEVSRAYTGEHARSQWLKHEPDLVLLDGAMRDVDSLALCQEMQRVHDALVIILAEEGDVHAEVRYLRSGADDFLRKPFGPSQLLAHIHAMSRRIRTTLQARPLSIVGAGSVRIDTQRNTATVHGKTVRLTPTEAKLLHLLAINAGQVCAADDIVTHVWGYGDEGDTGLIKAHIRHLREKLEPDPSKPRYIQTVSGVGYTLVRHIEESEPALEPARTEATLAPSTSFHRARSLAGVSALATQLA